MQRGVRPYVKGNMRKTNSVPYTTFARTRLTETKYNPLGFHDWGVEAATRLGETTAPRAGSFDRDGFAKDCRSLLFM